MNASPEGPALGRTAARARGVVVTAITAATAVAYLGGFATQVAPLVALFVLACPGLALVGGLRLRDPLFELVVGVALSISLAGLLATAELFAGSWAPGSTLVLLIGVTVVGLALDPDLIPRQLLSPASLARAGLTRASLMRASTRAGRGASGVLRGWAAIWQRRLGSPADVPGVMAPADPAPVGAPAAAPSARRARTTRPTRKAGATRPTPPPPTVIVARRLPAEERPAPPLRSRRRRQQAAVDEAAADIAEPPGTLRSVVRDVVGDLADRRDGKP